jgi:membrane dipeptidase
MDPKVKEILASSDVWDMTLAWVPVYWEMETLRRYKKAGYTFASLTLQNWPPTYERMLELIDKFKAMVAAESDWLAIGRSVAEIEAGKRAGKLVLGFNSQETLIIGHDLSRIESLHAAGIRHMLLAYNVRNLVADGCAEVGDAGLSNFGRMVVKEMDRVGIIVDGTHTGRRSTLEAMELTRRPPIFSHSGAYKVFAHIRNIHDDQIRACAAKGGVIGVVGMGAFLGDLKATTETYFKHIDYMAELVGAEHVGLGTDYVPPVFYDEAFMKRLEESGDRFWPPPEIGWVDAEGNSQRAVEGASIQPEQVGDLVGTMLTHGYSTADVKGILGENFKRVYATLG